MAVSKQTSSLGYTLKLSPFTVINPWYCAITTTYTSLPNHMLYTSFIHTFYTSMQLLTQENANISLVIIDVSDSFINRII